MARIFTTSFEFNHERYDAIVTVMVQDDQLNFHVKLLNDESHSLIPRGEIRYKGQKGFEHMQQMENNMAQSFLRSMAAAIDKHLTPA